MLRKSSTKINADFRKDIPNYSDEQIIEILKKRDHYQPEAASLAIDEAIKRGIIFSEQDLFAEEYNVEAVAFSIFPSIKKAENKHRIRRSLARSLVLFGLLPLVYGIIQIIDTNRVEGGALFLLGVLWMYCSIQLIKQYHKILVQALFVLSILEVVYVYSQMIELKGLVPFDYILPGILFTLLMYALLLLKKLDE